MSTSSSAPTQSFTSRKLGTRLVSVATAAVLVGGNMFPSTALAAEWIEVEGNHHAAGTAVSGAGANGGSWSWDGADDMQLNNYAGGAIAAEGKLNIDLAGTNTITVDNSTSRSEDNEEFATGIYVSTTDNAGRSADGAEGDGDLAITGSGSLEVKGDAATTAQYTTIDGIRADHIVIDGTTVSVNIDGGESTEAGPVFNPETGEEEDGTVARIGHYYGIKADSSLVIRNGAKVNVSNTARIGEVDVWEQDEETGEYTHYTEPWGPLYGIEADAVEVDDSVVTVKSSDDAISFDGSMKLVDSELKATTELGVALWGSLPFEEEGYSSPGSVLTITNSDVDLATSAEGLPAVLAGKIVLDQESGDTAIRYLDGWGGYTLGTKEPVQDTVTLRRTGAIPKHLAATKAAGLPQTGDPLAAGLPGIIGAGAAALMGLGACLRRRNEEQA